ncbi:MAG: hypothetical protein VX768_03570, partial [Planctomycetota bacterium]|nr:hypothetical protein [Planctomycetota bacterium]
ASKLLETTPGVEQRIRRMYEQAFSRPPSRTELKNATDFLEQQARELRIKPEDIPKNVDLWKDLCHVMMNVKEFIYLK